MVAPTTGICQCACLTHYLGAVPREIARLPGRSHCSTAGRGGCFAGGGLMGRRGGAHVPKRGLETHQSEIVLAC